MKAKLLTLCFVLAVTGVALSPISQAAATVSVFAYTDKNFYRPGETGTMNFWVYNDGTENLILYNISIAYPWDLEGFWGNNQTITPPFSTTITPGGNWSATVTFTVPNDGRAISGSATFIVRTDKRTETEHVVVLVTNTTSSSLNFQNMDQLTTMLMWLAVAVIVCGVIIALAILVSGRRHATWRTEPKPP